MKTRKSKIRLSKNSKAMIPKYCSQNYHIVCYYRNPDFYSCEECWDENVEELSHSYDGIWECRRDNAVSLKYMREQMKWNIRT